MLYLRFVLLVCAVVAVLSEDSLERIERAPITSNTHTEPRGCLGSSEYPLAFVRGALRKPP